LPKGLAFESDDKSLIAKHSYIVPNGMDYNLRMGNISTNPNKVVLDYNFAAAPFLALNSLCPDIKSMK
jgi:hypothetical protein